MKFGIRKLETGGYQMVALFVLTQFISFRECFRHGSLKPLDGIAVSFVKSLQPVGELCLWAVVDSRFDTMPVCDGRTD